MPYETSLQFDSVALIESLGPPDRRTGRDLFEGTLAPISVRDPGFVSEIYDVGSRMQFFGALRTIHDNSKRYGRSPIVHLETHGNRNGISLRSGELVTWSETAPFLAVGAEYASNIQIAELNALNAALAVIRWKKLLGFYRDLEREYHCTYTLDGNVILNDDRQA